MVMIGDQDFIAGLEVHAFDDDVAAFAGVARDGDLIKGDAQHARDFPAERLAHAFVLIAILERRIRMKIAQVLEMPVEHQPRSRAHIGRVEIDEIFCERILALHHLPVAFVARIRQARRRRGLELRPKRLPGYRHGRQAEKIASRVRHGEPPLVNSLYARRVGRLLWIPYPSGTPSRAPRPNSPQFVDTYPKST